ncbi:MAG: multidrug efflux SMR transporter [Gammaproteobacteria bacterium]
MESITLDRRPAQGPAWAWALLGLAVAGETAGALGLRFSAGFTRTLPTLFALAAFGAALVIVARVMRALPVSIAYPVWAGGGTVGVAVLGVAWLGEPLTLVKGAGVALVLAGVVLINRVAEKACGC